jgi:Uma2 family endonuclease
VFVSTQPRAMNYAEFLDWADEDTLAEWVNGEIVMTSPATIQHQLLSKFLTKVLDTYIQMRGLGTLLYAPFQMKLKNGREPDLLFVKREHLARLQLTYLDGPADLVIEIVSPESARRDRADKFYEYAEGGVPEYWLIDPEHRRAEFYVLENDYYMPIFSGRMGRYTSAALPGFWLQAEWLWQDPLPSPLRVLAEIVGMDSSVAEAFEKALAG